ncbi:MAG: hypothetical protein R3Y35_12410 [Clostridia bacterium]
MDIKYRLYPHPVLWEQNDDYQTSKFECEISLEREPHKFILNSEFILTNPELQNLIDNNQAEFIVHIESPASSFRIVEKSITKHKNITLKDENLLGKISLCPFIVAKEDITSFINADWNIDYDGVKFEIEKGTILAIGSQSSFKVDKEKDDLSNVSSIFTVYKKEIAEEMPMEIDLSENKIIIGLNINDYSNYSMYASDNSNVINSFIIFPVLVFTFERIKESFDEYKDCRWFRALEKMFLNYSLKLDEDLIESRTSIGLAQQVMKLPISNALKGFDKEDNYEEDSHR